MNSGIPGGTSSERGCIRCSGSPASSSDCRTRYDHDCWYPANGSSRNSIRESHFTFVIPYQPGTTRRSGKPCCGGSGAPFIS